MYISLPKYTLIIRQGDKETNEVFMLIQGKLSVYIDFAFDYDNPDQTNLLNDKIGNSLCIQPLVYGDKNISQKDLNYMYLVFD